MKQNVNRTKQDSSNIQIRSGTYSHQFSNRPNLLERDCDSEVKTLQFYDGIPLTKSLKHFRIQLKSGIRS